jgi:putative ABC transport system permease protein
VVVACLASTAVLLAVLGIYSVIAFSVGSREQEMAIRITLGAQRAGIMRLVVTSGAQLALVGCGLGFVGALASSRLLRSLLFDVSPLDPVVLISSSVVMLLLAVAASSLPAWRAAEIDPIQALRGE